MKLRIASLLFLLLLPLAAAVPARAQEEKPKLKLGLIISEKDQKEKDKRDKKDDAEVLDSATDAFVSSGRFTMVERNQLGTVLTEKSLQDFIGGTVNNKLSDVLDLDLVGIVGHTVETRKISKGETETRWIIDVRLIDVKTAGLVTTVTSDRASLGSMLPPATPREAGNLLAQSVREAFPPLGYVIKIDGKDVMVDLGTEVGLKENDTLEVVQQGEDIIHPVTGKIISAPLKVVGELKVKSANPQLSICKSKKGEVKEGSFVRLKETESKVIKGLMLIPRIKHEILKKKKEMGDKEEDGQ
jgi:hypothetical protein